MSVRTFLLLNYDFGGITFGIAENAEKALPSIGKLRSSADTFFTNGQFDESIKMWNQVIQLEPQNESNFYKRFRVYLRQQKYKEAISDLSSVLELNPSHENALVQRAKLFVKIGKCAEAVHDLEKLKKYDSIISVNRFIFFFIG